jgi:outer membrane lipoprotein-sorting protein
MKQFITYIFLLLFATPCFAQQADEEIKEILITYENTTSFQYKMKVKVSNQLNRSEKAEITTFTIKTQDNNYYSEQQDYVIIINEEYYLMVDNRQKIVLLDSSGERYKPDQYKFTAIFDSLLSKASTKELVKVSDNTSKISLAFEQMEISRIDLYYNPGTKAYQRLVYTYSKSFPQNGGKVPVVDIEFLEFIKNPELNENTFSIETYIVKNKNKLSLSKAYGTYQFFNQID